MNDPSDEDWKSGEHGGSWIEVPVLVLTLPPRPNTSLLKPKHEEIQKNSCAGAKDITKQAGFKKRKMGEARVSTLSANQARDKGGNSKNPSQKFSGPNGCAIFFWKIWVFPPVCQVKNKEDADEFSAQKTTNIWK